MNQIRQHGAWNLIDVMTMKDIFQLCRAFGVESFRINDMHVTFGPDPQPTVLIEQPMGSQSDAIKQPIGGELAPTQDEFLFWSAGESPDISAKPPEM